MQYSPLKHYILKGKEIVEADFMTWAYWFETKERLLKQEQVNGYFVSTVFLGMPHAGGMFETMVFTEGDYHPKQYYMERCHTYDEALQQHNRVVGMVLLDDVMFAPVLSETKIAATGKMIREPKNITMVRRLKNRK